MKRLGLLFVLILILSGCSSYTALKHFNKNEAYSNAVKNSNKAYIINKEGIKTIFYATYMNKVLKNKNYNYNFVISIYSEDESIYDYDIRLNTQSYISIEEINQNDKIFDNLSLKNRWAKHYNVFFKKEENVNKLIIQFTNPKNLKTSLSFSN